MEQSAVIRRPWEQLKLQAEARYETGTSPVMGPATSMKQFDFRIRNYVSLKNIEPIRRGYA